MAGITMTTETVIQVINFDGMKEMSLEDPRKMEQEKGQAVRWHWLTWEFLENMNHLFWVLLSYFQLCARKFTDSHSLHISMIILQGLFLFR